MKILFFGRGVIASIYGWALEQAGHDVEFYVRPGRSQSLGTIQLDLLDTRHRIFGERVQLEWPVRCRETLSTDHDFDLIVVSVAHYSVPEAFEFLAPRTSNATVLMFSNLWSEPLASLGTLNAEQVAWGFPAASGSFTQNERLQGVLMPSVYFGTFDAPPSERELRVRAVFHAAGFGIDEETDFRGWLWIHFILNAGLHSQAMRAGSLARMAGSTRDIREGLIAAWELLPLVAARGVDLRRHRALVLLLRAPAWLTAFIVACATAYFEPARLAFTTHSTAHEREPLEICCDALQDAQGHGIPAPHLEAALALVASNS